jgi:hypothetical protein
MMRVEKVNWLGLDDWSFHDAVPTRLVDVFILIEKDNSREKETGDDSE